MMPRNLGPLGAVVSQGIVAASSLALQLIALRHLGLSGLGTFSLLFGFLVLMNSVQTGWIGDSLTVLDRFAPEVRRALISSQGAAVVVASVIAPVFAFFATSQEWTTTALFTVASIGWLIEETLRRIFIARAEFWRLVLADATFAVGSVGLLIGLVASSSDLTMNWLMIAILVGAVAAIVASVALLPATELRPGPHAHPDMKKLASFALWRAAQVGLRPASLAIVRIVIVLVASTEALGALEAARILLAPVLTAVNGVGVYLLPTYSSQVAERRPQKPRPLHAIAGLTVLALAYGSIAAVLRLPLGELLSNGDSPLSLTALGAWTVFGAATAASVVSTNAVVARGKSRLAFEMRTIDVAIGTALGALLAVVGWVEGVPLGLAVGTVIGSALLIRRGAPPEQFPDGQ